MKYLILLLIFIYPLESNWKSERESLSKYYLVDEFRIFYDLKGPNALPLENQKDINKNGVPDYIENLALRLQLSKRLYTEVLNFRNPLLSERYKNIKYIDVHVLKADSSSTGDGINVFNYRIFNQRDKAIVIKLSNDLRQDTLTPSHEYFHAIQNGYSMFKNRWYTEGTSRWAEGAFAEGTGRREQLPQNNLQLKELLAKTYDAQYFWRKLAYECDSNSGIFEHHEWMDQSSIGYPKLIKDNRVYGYTFMKSFLENLDNEDNKLSFLRGVKEYEWEEKDQKYNTENNLYILNALMKTIKINCNSENEELKSFLLFLDKYIKDQYAN